LDAGASTGGFTEVLIDRGAGEVVAVDVGYGQLAWSLRSDPRVTVVERTNVRELTAESIGGAVDLVVADLSFISLSTVLPALTACAGPHADIVPMVKPQFEVGRSQVGAGGVVTDPDLRSAAVLAVARRAAELDWHTLAATASPLPGPSGNVEYFLWLRADTPNADTPNALTGPDLEAAVRRAVAEGPQ
jgi:23S rRNA (cytidine1920-2'-O)/16S rRNA (cytidine1409-2'-O)-methyltransferase